MKVTTLEPFGVQIQDLDIDNSTHQEHLRELLFKHGVIIIPKDTSSAKASTLHHDANLVKIAKLYGSIEGPHPVNNNTSEGSGVQILQTRGDTTINADSFLWHSDVSWRKNPTVCSVLCAKQLPKTGGDTCFLKANDMYNRLGFALQRKLAKMDAIHDLKLGYERVGRKDDVKTENYTAKHPVIIKHPHTGVPLLYINENFTREIEGLSASESDGLLQEVYAKCYDASVSRYVHKWSDDDIVIWDNYGVQHMAMQDYDELRTMHRVAAEEEHLVPKRYEYPDFLNPDRLSAYTSSYDEWCSSYNDDVLSSGYILPMENSLRVNKHVEGDSNARVLDIAAGTGLNVRYLNKSFEFHSIDYCDAMTSQARKQNLYSKYFIFDCNDQTQWQQVTEPYDGAICTGGFAKTHINAHVIRIIVNRLKPNGVFVFSVRSDDSIFERQVRDNISSLCGENAIEVLEDSSVAGITSQPELFHTIFVLKKK